MEKENIARVGGGERTLYLGRAMELLWEIKRLGEGSWLDQLKESVVLSELFKMDEYVSKVILPLELIIYKDFRIQVNKGGGRLL